MILGIRPETFEDAAFAPPELPTIDVEVVVHEELGSDAHVFFRVDATRIETVATEGEADGAADLVTDRGALLNARVDPRTSARVGEPLRLAVDPLASTSSIPTRERRCCGPDSRSRGAAGRRQSRR